MSAAHETLLEVNDLSIAYWQGNRWVRVVNGVSFQVDRGEVLGIVGESGCGKSTLAYQLPGYRHPHARLETGSVAFSGIELDKLNWNGLRRIRGSRIGFIPQNPTTALSPGMSVGRQIAETLVEHDRARSMAAARARVFEVMAAVGLPDPQALFDRYPHQLSGGQQQRVLIAAAIACQPELLILDEPTTGLDVTTQRQIIDLLSAMMEESGLAMVYVTHDLALLHEIATRIAVMYAGELVEIGPTETLFRHATHPYTRGLIGCVPSLQIMGYKLGGGLRGHLQRDQLPPGCRFQPRCPMAAPTCAVTPQRLAQVKPGHQVACQRWNAKPLQLDMAARPTPEYQSRDITTDRDLLEVDGVSISYGRQGRWAGLFGFFRPLVIRDIDFTIKPGETMALIGESGSGKSTVARAICGLIRPQSGSIRFEGRQIEGLAQQRRPELRRQIQYIFQNPDASLNPRRRVGEIVGRPIEIFFGREREIGTAVRQALGNVQLDPEYAARFPDELSGGERQRVAIARALAADPVLLLCDEILSALDVSVQASILALLAEVRTRTQVSMLFISHDLTVVRGLADRVCVLYGGQIMSMGPAAAMFEGVLHPYTESLLAAVPGQISHENRSRLLTALADQDAWGGGRSVNEDGIGCRFFSRCARRIPGLCDRQIPPAHISVDGVAIHCHLPLSTLSSLGAAGVGVPNTGVEIGFK